jgi:hypothetical protein
MLVVKTGDEIPEAFKPPPSSARNRERRAKLGAQYRADNAARMRETRAQEVPEFVCIDGEGMGKGAAHRYVLLGCNGDEDKRCQYENPDGIGWREAFEFLYDRYMERPDAAFVGFFLGYDFNQILKTLPQEKAWLLLTRKGKASRKAKKEGRGYFPVRCNGWEFDMLGAKRLQIRPLCCDAPEEGRKCRHKRAGWMSICDTGHFFQMGLLKVIDPGQWKDDPSGAVCTEAEYALVERGKKGRGDDVLDDDMRMYNHLENRILARVMGRLAAGFKINGVKLSKNQYYGPGAAAQKWLQKEGVIKRKEVEDKVPEWAQRECKGSYYGGWFEIFSHGLIGTKQMTTWNYDINSAYPHAIRDLPCLFHGRWERGSGSNWGEAPYILCHARVTSASNRIGAMPHRRADGSIIRPTVTSGWYWLDEIQASEKAGLVDSYSVDRWVSFTPECDHRPLAAIEEMYNYRLKIGKNSAAGMGTKLIINSDYGKFAQSIGGAPFGNWFYASRITSSCRIQILNAIASHPGGPESVLMVATDGIVFDQRHTGLPISRRLGEWDEAEYHELTLFMPGVYWHNSGKDNLLKVKTRGVPKAQFQDNIWIVEAQFREWHLHKTLVPPDYRYAFNSEEDRLSVQTVQGWPFMDIPINFAMTSCLQALMQGDWSKAGKVCEYGIKRISSDPEMKRSGAKWNGRKRRLDSFVPKPDDVESMPYKHIETPEYREGEMPAVGLEMPGKMATNEVIGAMRGDSEWTVVQDAQ